MAQQVFEVPFAQSVPQTFQITMAGSVYSLRVTWNVPMGNWILDINDNNNNPLVNGIPLITGTDLLGQYAYLNIQGQLICQTDHAVDDPPTYTNLGSQGHLYFLPTT